MVGVGYSECDNTVEAARLRVIAMICHQRSLILYVQHITLVTVQCDIAQSYCTFCDYIL